MSEDPRVRRQQPRARVRPAVAAALTLLVLATGVTVWALRERSGTVDSPVAARTPLGGAPGPTADEESGAPARSARAAQAPSGPAIQPEPLRPRAGHPVPPRAGDARPPVADASRPAAAVTPPPSAGHTGRSAASPPAPDGSGATPLNGSTDARPAAAALPSAQTPAASSAPAAVPAESPAAAPSDAATGPGGTAPGARAPRVPTVEPPIPISLDPPAHPDAWQVVVEAPGLTSGARAEGVTARLRLRLVVREDGTVGDVTVIVPSGRPALDARAASAARAWRFLPARSDGAPIASAVLVWVSFIAP